MRNNGEMEREILVEDGMGGEHVVKYLDEDRVIVQKILRYSDHDDEEYVSYALPGRVRLEELHSWPFTQSLKRQIADFHAQFTDSK